MDGPTCVANVSIVRWRGLVVLDGIVSADKREKSPEIDHSGRSSRF